MWKHQFWRLLTTFLYIGPLGLDFLFHAFFVLRYCRMLEEGKFRNSAEDFVMLFVFAIGWLWLIAPFLVSYGDVDIDGDGDIDGDVDVDMI